MLEARPRRFAEFADIGRAANLIPVRVSYQGRIAYLSSRWILDTVILIEWG
jgi:hypothetical protein